MTALIEQRLVVRENWDNRGGTPGQEKHLLTDLGMALSERVQKYNDFKNAKNAREAWSS